MANWECDICGYVYEESAGSLRDGVRPGTAFDALPADWVCPDCQMGREHFHRVEEPQHA